MQLICLQNYNQINHLKMNNKIVTLILIFSLICISRPHPIELKLTQLHEKDCYTQGLFFYNDTHIFQTCGLYNKSYFQLLEYTSNPFQIKRTFRSDKPWKRDIFMEGAILFKKFLYILTWRENVVYKMDRNTFEVLEEITWKRQGWGLTHNDTHMFTTDGSNNIYLVDQNFKLLQIKPINNKLGRKQYNINELQYVDGFIYANIYLDTKIVKIDYENGKIIQQYDGSKLVQAEKAQKNNRLQTDEVLNGIAYDKSSNKFILTGKHWKNYYQVQL